MAFKLNDGDSYEPLKCGSIKLRDYPKVFRAKCEELMEEGLATDMKEAERIVGDMEVELELYYEKGTGLFAVEAEAVESSVPLYSPYTGEIGERDEEETEKED